MLMVSHPVLLQATRAARAPWALPSSQLNSPTALPLITPESLSHGLVVSCDSFGFMQSDTLATLIGAFRGSLMGFALAAARWFASAGFRSPGRSRPFPLPLRLHGFDLLP
jgi:hypothetical protein